MTAAGRDDDLRLRTRGGHPDFLDLPWEQPLEEWSSERLVEVARGEHRHVVVFADYDGALYALKQMPRRLVRREHALLRRLVDEHLPAVEVVGTVQRSGSLEDVLITRFLDYSLPYRSVFLHQRRRGETDVSTLFDKLLDALAMLIVRLHMAGFFWGDCSLSNTLFRRDAGALAAYVVDVETGEWHPQLSEGQRTTDLEIAAYNTVGGLLDLHAELGIDPDEPGSPDPVEVGDELQSRYHRLWHELTDVEEITVDERYKLHRRIRRLGELGFDVDEIELVGSGDRQRLQFRAVVTEQGHHRRRLHSLTGLEAQENQARSLLTDLSNFRVSREHELGRPVSEQVAAHQWLLEVFEPTLAAVPEAQRGKLDPVELFHEVIEHKWFLSERSGRDVGVTEALTDYVQRVLVQAPRERQLLFEADNDGYMGYG